MEELLYSLLNDDLWSYGSYTARIACICGCLSPRHSNVCLFASEYVCVASVVLGGIWECVSVVIRWIINANNEQR